MLRRGLILLLTVQLSLTGVPVLLTLPTAAADAPAAPTRCPCCVTEATCQCCPKDMGSAEDQPARDGPTVIQQCRCSQRHLLLTSTQVLLTTAPRTDSDSEPPPAGKVMAVRETCLSIHLPPDPPPPRSGK